MGSFLNEGNEHLSTMPGNFPIRWLIMKKAYVIKSVRQWIILWRIFPCWGTLPMRVFNLQNISLTFCAEILLKPWLKEAGPWAKSSFRQFGFLSIERQCTMAFWSAEARGNWHLPKALTERLDTNNFFSAFSIAEMLLNKRTVSAWTCSPNRFKLKFPAIH